MTAPRTLELETLRPEGARLIEASAGTGKSYTIAGIYLLLVLESGLQVEQILVMTFTKAATAELRERIRKRLLEARRGFETGAHEDGFVAALIARSPDPLRARRRLDRALVDFDQAAVFTIHGFCQRALTDNAFESGAPFEVELLSDQDELILEVLSDFWRREVCEGDPRFVSYLLEELPRSSGRRGPQRNGPQGLLEQLRPHLGKPYVELRGAEPAADLEPAFRRFLAAWTALRDGWLTQGEAVAALLRGDPAINRRSYNSTVVARALETMQAFLAKEPEAVSLCRDFERFTSAGIAKGCKPEATPPRHPLFECCDALSAAVDEWNALLRAGLAGFKLRALRAARGGLAALKRRRQVQGFDDLLINLHRALAGEGGARLTTQLRKTYAAALVDEFQDTDPLQYDILRQLFLDTQVPLFLVGDPKQAIYSFRGADIYAYLAAKADLPEGYTLGTNWRSDRPLVQALNAVFGAAPLPFVLPSIPFHPVAAAQAGTPRLLEAGEALPPLRFWCLGSEHCPPDKPMELLSKGAARPLVAEAVGAEIARLLALAGEASAGVSLDGRPLQGGDIAVLVRTHQQADSIIKALQRRGIPCVQQSRARVFQSQEAAELERLLLAVLEPGREAWVRAALATCFIGADSAELLRLAADEADWHAVLERFQGYHLLWRDHGFMRCFRQLLRDYGVHQRLLEYVDGERRLTNTLHLGELLHGYAAEVDAGMEAALSWLARQRAEPGPDEAAELRLESDERLVKVVTIHTSKGLEYPVVFCPFLWDGRESGAAELPVAYHDPARDFGAVLDFGPQVDPQAYVLCREEALAEDLRLAYVALTRARHRCYVVWGKCRGLDSSGLGWLLHGAHAEAGPPAELLRGVIASRGPARLRQDLERLAEELPDCIELTPLPAASAGPLRLPAPPAPPLRARPFERRLQAGWRVTSFSALAGRVGGAAEQPDYDPEPAPLPPRREGEGIFAFPRGSRPGVCLHSIYQYCDFADPDPAARAQLVERALVRYGFAPGWTPVVAEHLQRVLQTPLDDGGLRLASVTRARRLDELEFYYPIKGLDSGALGRILRAHGFLEDVALRERIGRLQFSLAQGYMKGYIDLVFEHGGRYYLVDYKSNWLGPTLDDYGLEQVAGAMAEKDYSLQYLIYTVALHRYLGQRLAGYDYERHFGGVYYLFLRGMDPARGSRGGVFHDRPAAALIGGLDRYLRTGRVGEAVDVA